MILPWLATTDQRKFAIAGLLSQALMFLVAIGLQGQNANYAVTVIVCALACGIPACLIAKKPKEFFKAAALTIGAYAAVPLLGKGGDEMAGGIFFYVMIALQMGAAILFAAVIPFAAATLLLPEKATTTSEEQQDRGLEPAYIAFILWCFFGAMTMPYVARTI